MNMEIPRALRERAIGGGCLYHQGKKQAFRAAARRWLAELVTELGLLPGSYRLEHDVGARCSSGSVTLSGVDWRIEMRETAYRNGLMLFLWDGSVQLGQFSVAQLSIPMWLGHFKEMARELVGSHAAQPLRH